MILTNQELRPLLTGTAEITEQEGRLRPYRFGKHVREVVYPEGHRFHDATLHTSGVTLRFCTDSTHLSYRYAYTPAAPGSSFDTFVDGILLHHAPATAESGIVSLTLPAGKKTVTVYYPHHAIAQLYDLELDDGAALEPAPAPALRILFVGDSITHGSSSPFASLTYPHQVAELLHAEIVNQGISGAYFNPYATDDELQFTPDMVVLAFGTNDWSQTTRGIFVGAVNGHFARLRDKYPEIPIVSILPLWRADHTRITAVGSFEDAREIIRDAAARYDIHVVDGVELIPHVTDVFADSRLHPNAFGFQFYAEALAEKLSEIRRHV